MLSRITVYQIGTEYAKVHLLTDCVVCKEPDDPNLKTHHKILIYNFIL